MTHPMKQLTVSLLILTALTGCSDENSKARGQFIAGCIQGGAEKSVCACAFEKLGEQYTPTELDALSDTTQIPSEDKFRFVVQSLLQCRSE